MMLNVTDSSGKLGLESVSPVTLSSDWSRLARLILLASLASVGSIGNVFMISAVMIEDYLRKRGNAFVVTVALADLLVTGLVMPSSAVVILAGLQDNLAVCRFQWFLATLCFLVTSLSQTAIAAENHTRLCCSAGGAAYYDTLTRPKVTAILAVFWSASTITAALQFAPDLSFDYCRRRNTGLIPYQAAIGVVFVCLPLLLTFLNYVRIVFATRKAKARPNFKPPVTFNWDHSLMRTNLYSFVLFVIFWLPFGIVLAIATFDNRVANSLFYKLAWLALTKSCFNSMLYGIVNRHFRGAYVNLFHYCCCKTTVTFSRRQRVEGVRPSGDVRVHIIPGYNMYCSPQRAGRETQKRAASRPGSRDVYEL